MLRFQNESLVCYKNIHTKFEAGTKLVSHYYNSMYKIPILCNSSKLNNKKNCFTKKNLFNEYNIFIIIKFSLIVVNELITELKIQRCALKLSKNNKIILSKCST